MENKYFVDNGREYISWDMAQQELGISHMEFLRLLSLTGYNYMMNYEFDGKTYFERGYFESDIVTTFNSLKASNTLHRIQYKLPDKG